MLKVKKFCWVNKRLCTLNNRKTIRSYKQLPINLYHIQTKFRDEIRPRFGVMRAREFLMKDAYSFDMTSSGLDQSYEVMYATYQRIFNRLQLKYRAVLADTGTMGGSYSHEFQVLANTGEDIIVYSDTSDYAANLEKAESLPPEGDRPEPSASRVKVPVPSELDLSALARHLNMALAKLLKTFILKGQATPWIALVLRGDHSLNLIKVKELPEVLYPLEFASSEDMQNLLGCDPHAMGPVDLPFPYIVDREAAHAADFVCGGNQRGYCWKNVNWERDLGLGKIADIRDVLEGDRSPDGQGHLRFARGIEVGHIFKLNDRFSHKVDFSILDETGRPTYLQMGCYGIGISRIVAAAIEQHHDQHGIIWPSSIAPFCVGLIPIDLHRSVVVQRACAAIYAMLTDAGIEVFWDDRKERLGVLLADMDLIGIPHRLVIGERSLKCGTVEYKARRDKTGWALNMDNLLAELEEILSADLELT